MRIKFFLQAVALSLVCTAARAETIDVNNLMHYEILKRNINIGIEFTSDLRAHWSQKDVDITQPGHGITGNDGNPAVCRLNLYSRSGNERFTDYLWRVGDQVIFEQATLGGLIFPGHKTMSLMHDGSGSVEDRSSIWQLEVDNLPYSAADPLDYLYGNVEYEWYPMARFMQICDSEFVRFIFRRPRN